MFSIPDTPYPFTKDDRRTVARQLRRAPRVQIHYDWRSIDEWLMHPNLRGYVSRYHGTPQAFLGAVDNQTSNGDTVAWLRFILPGSARRREPGLDALWLILCDDLRNRGVSQIAMLGLENWTGDIVDRWGFVRTNAVITLNYQDNRRVDLPQPADDSCVIRELASEEDLQLVAALDGRCFDSIWQYDFNTLQAASRQATTFTVLERSGEMLGYQLSTRHGNDAHLSRLAVLPEVQGQGLGRQLVWEMIRFFRERGILSVTVNTQEDNIRSQRLYERIGFKKTGSAVPVWVFEM